MDQLAEYHSKDRVRLVETSGKARSIYVKHSAAALVNKAAVRVYCRLIRPLLPTKGYYQFGGVRVGVPVRAGDAVLPQSWKPNTAANKPNYESPLVCALKKHVRKGDKVVIVGGGWGVTTAVAAQQVGEGGSVLTFEGAEQWAERVRETARLNGVEDRVKVVHAVVARAISLRGAQGNPKQVAPKDLPPCDVLELDCEGAEVDVLRHMTVAPRVLLVETHGVLGAPTAEVERLLRERSYTVLHKEPEGQHGARKDIYVLVSRRDEE